MLRGMDVTSVTAARQPTMTGVIADRCPGVLRPHLAADGAMVRIRIPGGQTTGAALARLGELAAVHGSGLLQLTSRGSVQIRGLGDPVPDGFVAGITAAGFLPSAAHDRVRNVVASPLTGLSGGRADLRPLVTALDRELRAAADLAELSGRFLFALDDGRGDVLTLPFDVGYQALDPDRGVVIVGGQRRLVAATDAASALIDAARAAPTADPSERPERARRPSPVPLGAIGDHAGVVVPLGFLTQEQVAAVSAAAGSGPVVVTPWRGLVIPYAAARVAALAAAGLVVEDASPWTRITACVGAPYCAKARMETLAAARDLAERSDPATLRRTHLSGCERRCGAPTTAYVDLVAHA
jgi:precorrin-3B synthase